MSELSCGIVGLPNVGKSTLFNALTGSNAGASNFPFCTIKPNIGVVAVPDSRLGQLAELSESEQILPANMQFVDIAGLVKGASQGEGLGNTFLANIRETDAILQVVRCFKDDDIVHVHGQVDPVHDAQIIGLELILADLQMIENIASKMKRQAKSNKELSQVLDTLELLKNHLDKSEPLRTLKLETNHLEHIAPYNFLTLKPLMYIANMSEEDLSTPQNNPYYQSIINYAEQEGSLVIPLCAELESQLAQIAPSEQEEMFQAMGLKEPGLNRLIKASFELLGLITYLTAGPKETRAWTITKGSKAPQAAGKIHSDIEKGFIRAEVVSFEDILHFGGRLKAKEAGKVRLEGKDYIVQDSDVILFHHAT